MCVVDIIKYIFVSIGRSNLSFLSATNFFSEAFTWFANLSSKLPQIDFRTYFIVVVALLIGVGVIIGLTFFGCYRFKLTLACKKIIRYLKDVEFIDDDNFGDFTAQCFSVKAPSALRDCWVQYLGVRFGYPSDIVSEENVYDSQVKRVREIRANVYVAIALILLAIFSFWGYGTLDGKDMGVIFLAGLLLTGAVYLVLVILNRFMSKRCLETFSAMQEDLDAKVNLQLEKNFATDSSPLADLAAIIDEIVARNTAKEIGFEFADGMTPIEQLIASAPHEVQSKADNDDEIELDYINMPVESNDADEAVEPDGASEDSDGEATEDTDEIVDEDTAEVSEEDEIDEDDIDEEDIDDEETVEDDVAEDIDETDNEEVVEEIDEAFEEDAAEDTDLEDDEDVVDEAIEQTEEAEDIDTVEDSEEPLVEESTDGGIEAEDSMPEADTSETAIPEEISEEVDSEEEAEAVQEQDGDGAEEEIQADFEDSEADGEEDIAQSDEDESLSETSEDEESRNDDALPQEDVDVAKGDNEDSEDFDTPVESGASTGDGDADKNDVDVVNDAPEVRYVVDGAPEDEEIVKPAKLVKLPNLVDYMLTQNLSRKVKIQMAMLLVSSYKKFESSAEDKAIIINCMKKLMFDLQTKR